MNTVGREDGDAMDQESVARKGRATIVRSGSIGPDVRRAMFELFSRYFRNASFERLLADLEEKQWVILVNEQDGSLLGFSTIQCFDLEFEGRQVSFIFSGDTIVAPQAWQFNALTPAFGVFVERFINEHPGRLCCWYLISKGYRTYRSLPMFFVRFFPNFSEPTPPFESRLLASVSRRKFGEHFNENAGVIAYDPPLDYLYEPLQQISGGRDSDPHVKFFLEKNPGFTRGNELACIAELSMENLNRRAKRMIAAGRRHVHWQD